MFKERLKVMTLCIIYNKWRSGTAFVVVVPVYLIELEEKNFLLGSNRKIFSLYHARRTWKSIVTLATKSNYLRI